MFLGGFFSLLPGWLQGNLNKIWLCSDWGGPFVSPGFPRLSTFSDTTTDDGRLQLHCWKRPVPQAGGPEAALAFPLPGREAPESSRPPSRVPGCGLGREGRGRSDCPSKELSSEAAKSQAGPLWKREKVGRDHRAGLVGGGRVGVRAPPAIASRGGASSPAWRPRLRCKSSPRSPLHPPGKLGSTAAHASCAPRHQSRRLYLSSARAATQHSPGARGQGGRSALELTGAHSGALALLGSARFSEVAAGRRAERASGLRGSGAPGKAAAVLECSAAPCHCPGPATSLSWLWRTAHVDYPTGVAAAAAAAPRRPPRSRRSFPTSWS